MTNHYIDMKNSSCFLVFSNPAENHPASMQYINAARANGAKVLVVDPRRTRMAAMADQYVRIRPGTDIAFINGIIKRHCANVDAGDTSASTAALPAGPGANMRKIGAITSVSNWFHDKTMMLGMYWPTWTDSLYRTNEGYSAPAGQPDDYLRYGRDVNCDSASTDPNYLGDPNKAWFEDATNGAARRAWANANQLPVLANDLNAGTKSGGSKTVYEIFKARVAAYTSAEVAAICGCTATEFEALANTFLANSWAYDHSTTTASEYKAATILYAMGTTQHTHGGANVKSYANMQSMLGNMGKHGGGINALRGIGNVQGSTDQNLLYHILMAYVAVPPEYKIVAVNGANSVDVKGAPPVHNYAPDNGMNAYAGNDATKPEMCSRVTLGNANGFVKGNTYTYYQTAGTPSGVSGCGTPVVSVTAKGGGVYTVVTADALGSAAVGDVLFADYESWLYQKSFGGRTAFPGGGGNAVAPGGWSWSGGLPWGHQGTWSVVRTFFSEGMCGGTTGDNLATAIGKVNEHYNKYMPKGNGYDYRTMCNQTDPTMEGYDAGKTPIKGMLVWGMNPRVTVANSLKVQRSLEKLDFLIVADMFRTETANVPRKANAPTYFLPAASFAETAGTISNSGRWIQWRHQAALPKGDSKTDMEILFKLAYAMHTGSEADGSTWLSKFDFATGEAAYNGIWRDQYAGDGTTAGNFEGTNGTVFDAKKSLADPATAWDNDDYRASYQGEDNGIGKGGLGYPGYAERTHIQMSTNSNDKYGNAGTNWLHGSKAGGGGVYGAWWDPMVATGLDDPTKNAGYTANPAEDTKRNRTQARSANDSAGGKGLYPGFSWVWLRNRRVFYNKGGFCPGDVGDIYVAPDEIATTFVSVPGYSKRPGVVPYAGAWRGTRSMNDVPINPADRVWSKLGFTPVHWEPHESPNATLVAKYGQVGRPSDQPYANTSTLRSTFKYVLTTFRHTEHYQGGPMTRNVPWLNELVPAATIEINSYDAYYARVKNGNKVWLKTTRTGTQEIGPFIAVVGSGSTQKVGRGVLAIPWHWGSEGLSTGPTANDLCNDAADGNTNMPETKACLCSISRVQP